MIDVIIDYAHDGLYIAIDIANNQPICGSNSPRDLADIMAMKGDVNSVSYSPMVCFLIAQEFSINEWRHQFWNSRGEKVNLF